jgi:NDP-sugar pyrophosphorylase family protein
MTEVVVLAGGRGTRLVPYTTVLPKPLMPVGDMPVLEILLRQLARHELTTVHVAVGHLAGLLEAYFGDGSQFGVELRYWHEAGPLGTAGPLATIETGSDRIVVMNGDLLTTLNFKELVDTHVASGAAATVGVHRREVPIDFGVVKRDGLAITGFDEKPTLSYEVSMGVYVVERSAVELIPKNEHFDFPDFVLLMLEHGFAVNAYLSDAFWLDIGRHEDYELAVRSFDELRDDLLGPDE